MPELYINAAHGLQDVTECSKVHSSCYQAANRWSMSLIIAIKASTFPTALTITCNNQTWENLEMTPSTPKCLPQCSCSHYACMHAILWKNSTWFNPLHETRKGLTGYDYYATQGKAIGLIVPSWKFLVLWAHLHIHSAQIIDASSASIRAWKEISQYAHGILTLKSFCWMYCKFLRGHPVCKYGGWRNKLKKALCCPL